MLGWYLGFVLTPFAGLIMVKMHIIHSMVYDFRRFFWIYGWIKFIDSLGYWFSDVNDWLLYGYEVFDGEGAYFTHQLIAKYKL